MKELIPSEAKTTAAKAVLESALQAIESAAELVEQLELQATSAPSSARGPLVAKVREYKATVSRLRADYKAASSNSAAQDAARAELLAGASDAQRAEAETQRARLLATTERLQRGSDTLRGACKVAIETEAVGASIMSDLESQRHTLESARGRLAAANSGLARSKKLLKGMGRRALANKLLMMVIIGVLVLLICVVIYLSLFYKGRSPAPPPPVGLSSLRAAFKRARVHGSE